MSRKVIGIVQTKFTKVDIYFACFGGRNDHQKSGISLVKMSHDTA